MVTIIIVPEENPFGFQDLIKFLMYCLDLSQRRFPFCAIRLVGYKEEIKTSSLNIAKRPDHFWRYYQIIRRMRGFVLPGVRVQYKIVDNPIAICLLYTSDAAD